jgi:hypothetical protein
MTNRTVNQRIHAEAAEFRHLGRMQPGCTADFLRRQSKTLQFPDWKAREDRCKQALAVQLNRQVHMVKRAPGGLNDSAMHRDLANS